MQRVGLHQQPTELHAIEQLPQSLDLTAAVGGVGALSDRDAEAVGIQAHLGDEARCAGGVLGDRTPQGLAIADQGFDHFGHAWLRRDPLLQQGFKAFHIQLAQQPAEGRVRRRFGDVSAEELIERLAVAFGEPLHPEQGALAAQDRENRHQQHPPLRKAHPAAHAAVRQRFEEADQVSGCSRALERRRWQGSGAVRLQGIPVRDWREARLGRTFNRPWITSTTRKGKRDIACHRFITSLRTTPEALLRLIRQRWSIENEWHWVRDTQLGEDAHRYTNRTGVAVFSFLRTVVMNLLRRGGYRSIRQGFRELAYDIKGMLALGGVTTHQSTA